MKTWYLIISLEIIGTSAHSVPCSCMAVTSRSCAEVPLREGTGPQYATALTLPNMEAKCCLPFIIELEFIFFLSGYTFFYSHTFYEKREGKRETPVAAHLKKRNGRQAACCPGPLSAACTQLSCCILILLMSDTAKTLAIAGFPGILRGLN